MFQVLKSRKLVLVVITILFFSFQFSHAQGPTSLQDTTTYKVKPGDTKYSLAKRFGMTIKQLEDLNPEIVDGLRAGHVLKVNASETTPSSYVVKKGDTKFSLAKRFGISIQTLEEANPHIVPVLKTGAYLEIPSSTNNVSVNTTATSNSTQNNTAETTTETEQKPRTSAKADYVDYAIKPKETVYGLSKRAQMTIPEFLQLNPQLSESVIIGTIIKMPSHAVSPQENATSLPNTSSEFDDLTRTINKAKASKVLFALPFNENEYKNYLSNPSEDILLNQTTEFYKGASIAIDSVKSFGLLLSTELLKVKAENIQTVKEAESIAKRFTDYDAVIAPNYDSAFKTIASNTNVSDTPLILGTDNRNAVRHENVYVAYPSLESQKLKMLQFINSKNSNTIVVIEPERKESKNFISANIPQAHFIETKVNEAFNEKELTSVLKSYATNFVIIESDKKNNYLNITNILLPKLADYDIQLVVLEPSLIPGKKEVSNMRYKLLRLTYPTVVPISFPYANIKFSKTFKQKYGTDPTAYAKYGFDITFDTLLRVAQTDGFVSSAKRDITSYLNGKIEYKRDRLGGYTNDGIYIMQYDPEKGLTVIN